MSTPSDSAVSSTTASVDSVPVGPETKKPWLPNQAELGSLSLPWFITSLFQHIKVSPSQLAPNSYSFLLALDVLLSYFNIPLIPYVLMQLIQIKRLGPGKFYLSHNVHQTFIGGNPSSHKGWMSRFFYVRRIGRRRNPWGCEMSWRDNVYTFTPSTTERSPNLISFLDAMHDKCYSASELVKEDLLCHFEFSRKGVKLVGDLAERIGKAALLKALKELPEEGYSGAAEPPMKVMKKMKATSFTEKEAKRHKKKEASTSQAQPTPTAEKHQAPMPPVSMRKEHRASKPPSPTSPEMVRGGEVISRLTQAQLEVNDTRKSFDEMLEHQTEMEMQLADLETARAQENRAAEVENKALEAQVKGLMAEKEALATNKEALEAKKRVIGIELDALLAKKIVVEVEFDETKARAEAEIGRLRNEIANAWGLGKEEFLKSSEFDDVCAKRSLAYFESGFKSCVAQFRANGYSEEENPAPFLSVAWALDELPDDE
ncbi:hypothetical protein F511_32150 [Dorcoceras hygrometricum]|uniref:Uncharacterized protein n=1 Tax=Dorcoceras hygrometricum TaxID=472368 RepID=A0A2Z7DDS5_9LAMI|nr:hypothetical protein F511_32150 [Dorcoceras hygrometricum]